MSVDLVEIRGRLAAATPWPWLVLAAYDAGTAFVRSPASRRAGGDLGTCDPDNDPAVYDRADAELIAHAPDDLAALCDEVERLREERDAAIRTMDDHRCREAAERAYEKVLELRDRAADVRALHRPEYDGRHQRCSVCRSGYVPEPYPCPTIRALDGEDGTKCRS